MYVDNSGIRHECEELGQAFEKFVVMAMNPGADFDSLPILDNPDNFVVHALRCTYLGAFLRYHQ